ncbi:Spindle and kinetochore-associated protein 1 like [Apostasia shenzhenica]|uniref:SKA complex subunit 1 homolog n=1 Tax=Apostasia shenzhenica TaxID=1088818 RepID=A0A2I0AVI6_9ASPA|nr:Spindle and kinetochore-associated protein 1 like [Apostasia shenzhenica]
MPDLSAMDATLAVMESQVQAIKDRLQEERSAIPKAKKLIQHSLNQQKKLQHMLAYAPSRIPESMGLSDFSLVSTSNQNSVHNGGLDEQLIFPEEPVLVPKEKKGRFAPRWYVTASELDSVASYMRGRLTLDKVNFAISEMATYADSNFQLITLPKKKLSDDSWERALELRDIAMSPELKGRHFLLETDIKGPGLKLDNTGKATIIVLRHLGRVLEFRIGQHRVIALLPSP